MKVEGWVCFAGTELANSNRTLTYVRRNLAGTWRAGLSAAATADSTLPTGLAAYCAASSDARYVSPAADNAPWYDGAIPASAEFLGLSVYPEINTVLRRQQLERLDKGATVGRLQPLSRVIPVSGLMFASSQRGMAYGERWVNEVLAGSLCRDQASRDELEILTYCDVSGFRRLVDVGIADGPIFTKIDEAACTAQEVSFQLAAGIPELFTRPSVGLNNVTITAGNRSCFLINAPNWTGDVVTQIQLTAPDTNAVTGIVVSAVPTRENTCPEDRYAPCARFEIDSLPAGERLTIDGRRELVTRKDPASKAELSGFALLDFDGPFAFPTAGPGAKVCVCVSVGASSPASLTARLETYTREL